MLCRANSCVSQAPKATVLGGDVVYPVTTELGEQPPELCWGVSVAAEIDTG